MVDSEIESASGPLLGETESNRGGERRGDETRGVGTDH
jgi:hypothetical protein